MPDERAVMTSVSSYYHTFAGAQKVECFPLFYASFLVTMLLFGC